MLNHPVQTKIKLRWKTHLCLTQAMPGKKQLFLLKCCRERHFEGGSDLCFILCVRWVGQPLQLWTINIFVVKDAVHGLEGHGFKSRRCFLALVFSGCWLGCDIKSLQSRILDLLDAVPSGKAFYKPCLSSPDTCHSFRDLLGTASEKSRGHMQECLWLRPPLMLNVSAEGKAEVVLKGSGCLHDSRKSSAGEFMTCISAPSCLCPDVNPQDEIWPWAHWYVSVQPIYWSYPNS